MTSSATSTPASDPHTIINVRGVAVGLLICEDVWTANGPAAELARQGATLLVVANASPYARGRREEREAMLRERALETNCPIAYVNLVGGQDELVYDGQSVVVNAQGDVIARATAFSEELLVCDIDARASTQGVALNIGYARDDERLTALHVNRIAEPLSEVEEVYQALVMGTRDYLRKNGFRTAVIALSGGVDSSLVAAIAVDAVGARAVRGFAMPSRYSSDHSVADAARARVAPRHRDHDDPDRERPRGLRRGLGRGARTVSPRGSPTRTCSRASAASC